MKRLARFGRQYRDEIPDGRASLPWSDFLFQDLRMAMRSLRRNRVFAAATIITLALGIGANTAIFSVVYAALLQPLPYAEPDQIFSVETVFPDRQDQVPSLPMRIQDFLEWRRADTAFSAVAALTPSEWNLTGTGEALRLGGARVSVNFFSFLGVPVASGRGFRPEEELPGRDRVVVISDALWRSRYGGSPTVLNSTIFLNGDSHVVVGIAPPSLLVPTGPVLHPSLSFAPRIDIWKPIAPTPRDLEGENWNYGLLVRLKPGESVERGRVQLQAMLNRSLRAIVPDLTTEFQTRLTPIREIYAGKIRLRLLLVAAAAGMLLLVACANVANLYLGRVASRSQEFAVRVALGARRSRILGQMLTESTCLALIGGALGVVFAYLGVGALLAQGPPEMRALADTRPKLPVLAASILASVATGLACGFLPAWRAYRKDARAVLQEGARGTVGGDAATLRQALVSVELALSTALLASAGLLLHSFVNVTRADRGYEVEHVLALELSPGGQRYATGPQRTVFFQGLLTEVQALPGVLAAGAVNSVPALGESGTQVIFFSTDTDSPGLALQRPVAGLRNATPGYFTASGTALRAGRAFTEQDVTPVAVIGESLGRRLWPGDTPASLVGRTIRQGAVNAPDITVVGVAQDVRPGAVDRELPPQLYRPHHQAPSGRMSVLVRTAQDPSALSTSLRDLVRRADPTVPIAAMRTMEEIVSGSLVQRRFQMVLTSLFGIVALLLGAVGVYGVVSYTVVRRTREIGLRLALGATRQEVIVWVFSRGMRPVFMGVGVGVLGAMALAQTMRHLLFGVGPLDPAAFGGVAFVLLMAAALACYLPARRAAELDPLTALRQD
jgi:putative ABC transport system permease protein